MPYLLLVILSILLGCSNQDDNIDANSELLNYQLEYPGDQNLTSGEARVIQPSVFYNMEDTTAQCTPGPNWPDWLSLDPNQCSIEVNAIAVGSWGPYTVNMGGIHNPIATTIQITVEPPLESQLPPPTTLPAVTNYYMSSTLPTNSNYFASFDSGGIHFFNATNPYAPNLVGTISVTPLGHGQPQALTFIDQYLYVVTSTGYILVFNWSDLEQPIYETSYRVLNGGQNYDLDSDGNQFLFIANTTHTRFSVVDVSQPTQPESIYNFDDLSSFGSGVTFHQGTVYVADFSGQIFSFQQVDGAWTHTGTVNTSFSSPHRLASFKGRLIVPQYNSNQVDIFSLTQPQQPQLIQTLNFEHNINVYTRPLFHNNKLYLTHRGEEAGYFSVHQVPTSLAEDLNFAKNVTPNCPGPQNCADLMGLNLFRNHSFLSFIGVDISNGMQRHLLTDFMPLHEKD
jgi:hypothetical protein